MELFDPNAAARLTSSTDTPPDLNTSNGLTARFQLPRLLLSYRANAHYDDVMPQVLELLQAQLPDLHVDRFTAPLGSDDSAVQRLFQQYTADVLQFGPKVADVIVADGTTIRAARFPAGAKVIELETLSNETAFTLFSSRLNTGYYKFLQDFDKSSRCRQYSAFCRNQFNIHEQLFRAAFPSVEMLPERLVIFTDQLKSHHPFDKIEENTGEFLGRIFEKLGMPPERIIFVEDAEDLTRLVMGETVSGHVRRPVERGEQDTVVDKPGKVPHELLARIRAEFEQRRRNGDDFLGLKTAKSVMYLGDCHLLANKEMVNGIAEALGMTPFEVMADALMGKKPKKQSSTAHAMCELLGLYGLRREGHSVLKVQLPLPYAIGVLCRNGLLSGPQAISSEEMAQQLAEKIAAKVKGEQ